MRFHPDVLAAHAQFGGDLEDMQRRYDAASPAPSLPEDVERVVERLNAIDEETMYDSPASSEKTIREAAALIQSLSSQLVDLRAQVKRLERERDAARNEDAKMQLLYQQEQQIIDLERQAQAEIERITFNRDMFASREAGALADRDRLVAENKSLREAVIEANEEAEEWRDIAFKRGALLDEIGSEIWEPAAERLEKSSKPLQQEDR